MELKNLEEYPSFPPRFAALLEGKWNGKVYGTKGDYCAYLSGVRYHLSDDDAIELKNVLEAREEWKKYKMQLTKIL